MKSSMYLFPRLFKNLLRILCLLTILSACKDDDMGMEYPPLKDATTYELRSTSGSNINGYVIFSQSEENETDVVADVRLAGTEAGVSYPVYLKNMSAIENGGVAVTLTPVSGELVSGTNIRTSRTVISKTEGGEALTLASMANFDGHVVVQKGEDNAVVAIGNIGGNTATDLSKTYTLSSIGGSKVGGNVVFSQLKTGLTQVRIELDTTGGTGVYPAHIHNNAAIVSGDIAIDLNAVDASTGKSTTIVRKKKDGTAITYEQLLAFNGYVNVHQSPDNLEKVIAQTDIGGNTLTGESTTYQLDSMMAGGQIGEVTFAERENKQALVTIMLEGAAQVEPHPAHIHANTAAETGDIMISLTNVVNNMSVTNVAMFDNGTPVTYDSLTKYNGYVNVHQSMAALGTVISQADIGQNGLTGESVVYPLNNVLNADTIGIATFYQRNDGTTLVALMLTNPLGNGTHPAHIHINTAAEGGDIAVSLNNVDGTTGMSKTSVRMFDNGSAVTYEQLFAYDGYINVHQSALDLATIIAQGDVGINKLTGEQKVYTLAAVGNSGVSGTATFAQRKSGASLVTLVLDGTSGLNSHPAHIHFNSASETGNIAISLNDVDGVTGLSKTNVEMLDNNVGIDYEGLLGFDGYINVHQSALDLATILAQGDIGSNIKEDDTEE